MKIRLGFILFSTLLAFQAGPASAANTVRSNDIVDGEVKNVDIGANAVTTGKIMDGTIDTNDIANSAVTTGKIAAGAVDDSKITGPISATKISSAGLNADTVDGKHAADLASAVHGHTQADVAGLATSLAGKAGVGHNHDGVYLKKYSNVVVVAKSGGDFIDPFTAMNSIIDASESNPYLVKIMPGIYDLGANSLLMKQYVDIEGSGEKVTQITSAVSTAGPIVFVAAGDEMRFLTVKNAGTGQSTLIENHGALTNVTANYTGAGNVWGVYNLNGSMTNVTLDITTLAGVSGVINNESTMTNVTVAISAGGGTAVLTDGSCIMNSVSVKMTSPGVAFGFQLAGTEILNNVVVSVTGGDSLEAYGVYSISGTQILNNVVVSVTGGTAFGIYKDATSPFSVAGPLDLNNVTVNTTGTTGYSYGIMYGGMMNVALKDITVNTSSVGSCHALYFWGGTTTTTMTNVTAIAKNGTSNSGLSMYGISSISVDRSTIEGATNSIDQPYANATTPLIGSSKLVGSVGGSGSYTCVASYNGSYQPLNNQCQ